MPVARRQGPLDNSLKHVDDFDFLLMERAWDTIFRLSGSVLQGKASLVVRFPIATEDTFKIAAHVLPPMNRLSVY